MEFAPFDQRNYPTLPVQEGYTEWALSYDETPLEAMDIRLLERNRSVHWPDVRAALDLACGTGRIGAWLDSHGVRRIDGVDFTPAMLERAQQRGIYNELVLGSVSETGLPAAAYDLAVMALADEHLSTLEPVYAEAARVTVANGRFILIGYHPHFLLNGVPTHYHRPNGDPITIESHIHLFTDHVRAAHAAGWRLSDLDEALIGDDWIARKPKWERWRDHPVSFCLVWEKRGLP
jgi:SAM-dependent methyltransferase